MNTSEAVRLVSIQVGSRRPVLVAGRQATTGIRKEPVATAPIEELGLVGDFIADAKNHGGPDQAVYVYSNEDYSWWESQLDVRLPPGRFGENLTFSSFGNREPMVGDLWRIGDVVLETTAPRTPCSTFGAVMNDPDFPKLFRAARRPGFYARVLHSGIVSTGAAVSKTPSDWDASVNEMFDLAHETDADPAVWQRLLAAPIAERTRTDYERRLQRRSES